MYEHTYFYSTYFHYNPYFLIRFYKSTIQKSDTSIAKKWTEDIIIGIVSGAVVLAVSYPLQRNINLLSINGINVLLTLCCLAFIFLIYTFKGYSKLKKIKRTIK
jgi:hypothetical protein